MLKGINWIEGGAQHRIFDVSVSNKGQTTITEILIRINSSFYS